MKEEPLLELSVVIACTRPDRVMSCLDGLSSQAGRDLIEALVVGSVPDALPDEKRTGFPVEWIACENTHANARRNMGIERANAPRIAMLDDDTIPEEGWIEAALTVPVDGMVIRTGPEEPVRQSEIARLIHAVYSGPVGEVSGGHHMIGSRRVSWYQIPFSNFVTSSALLARSGPLSETIPWDMDDFDFCHGVRDYAVFESDPRLRVRHDRYPDTIGEFISYLKRLRTRTGEKLVTHPGIYWKVPAVAACACLPLLGATATALEPLLAPAGFLAYLLLVLGQLPRALRTVGRKYAAGFLLLTFAVHLVTVACVQYGLLRGLVGRLSGGAGAGPSC